MLHHLNGASLIGMVMVLGYSTLTPRRFWEDILVIFVNPNPISVISQSSSHHLLFYFYKLKPRKITPNAFSLSDTYPSMAASFTTLVVLLPFIFSVTKHTPFF
jgi:hypothetical protein